MNESIKVQYDVEKKNENGSRIYTFTHMYAAPADEAFAALEEIKEYLLVKVAEIQNAQLAATGQQPVMQDNEVTNGN
jgi:hypothetical protein